MPGADDKIKRIAAVLVQYGLDMRVEGHSDDVPIHNAEFASNWDLSTARATAVAMMLLNEAGVDPKRSRIAGYGQYHPKREQRYPGRPQGEPPRGYCGGFVVHPPELNSKKRARAPFHSSAIHLMRFHEESRAVRSIARVFTAVLNEFKRNFGASSSLIFPKTNSTPTPAVKSDQSRGLAPQLLHFNGESEYPCSFHVSAFRRFRRNQRLAR